jgi:hypothetical protein
MLFSRRQPKPFESEKNSEFEAVGAFNNSDLYNAMLYPFTRMVITGAIWYQGNLGIKKK